MRSVIITFLDMEHVPVVNDSCFLSGIKWVRVIMGGGCLLLRRVGNVQSLKDLANS